MTGGRMVVKLDTPRPTRARKRVKLHRLFDKEVRSVAAEKRITPPDMRTLLSQIRASASQPKNGEANKYTKTMTVVGSATSVSVR